MPTQTALSTLNADSDKGRKATDLFRHAYNRAGLNDEEAQNLNEHAGFAAYLAEGIRKFSTRGPAFAVYLDIEVGGKSKDELLTELKSSGCSVSDWAKDIMSKPTWKPGTRERVKFARATVRDLGFTQNPTTAQIWARISELGHALCEPGDGPAIRLALKDQPRGDYFWLAMEQITDSGGDPGVFDVERDGDGRWLGSDWARPDDRWSLDNGVVVRLRK